MDFSVDLVPFEWFAYVGAWRVIAKLSQIFSTHSVLSSSFLFTKLLKNGGYLLTHWCGWCCLSLTFQDLNKFLHQLDNFSEYLAPSCPTSKLSNCFWTVYIHFKSKKWTTLLEVLWEWHNKRSPLWPLRNLWIVSDELALGFPTSNPIFLTVNLRY
jgi:hypothetical protein